MEFSCLECDKKFDNKRSFHLHLKAHALTIGDYYVKHYERKDLYSGDKIPFRSYDQYFRDNFINYDNFKLWMDSAPKEEVKTYIKTRAKQKFELKNIKTSPPNLFYDLSEMANIFYYKKLWGSYSCFLNELGLKNHFIAPLPQRFWEESHDDIPIFTDTREKAPLKFNNTVINKLDFGDYTARGDLYTKTFVDRKAQDDFRQTFGKDIKRFRREMDRCVEFNSYMFVVAETTISKLEEHNKKSKFKSNLGYLWHNIRNLLIDYPHNLQIIFAHSRAGAKKLIPLILHHGDHLWNTDLQYFIDERINVLDKGKTRISA
tara:strand:+ start:252 stop:1202 length:951 start_codon:yes stop_codon:yes gene_type:complete